MSVIEAISNYSGVEPEKLDPPLYHVIDPEALDVIFSPLRGTDSSRGTIKFTYLGYEVVVDSDGEVGVTDSGESSLDEQCET